MAVFNSRRLRHLSIIVLLVVAAGVVVWAVGVLARENALGDLRHEAAATGDLDLALLDSELQRHRAIPVILASEERLSRFLSMPTEAGRAEVNARLETIATQTGAAAVYVLDTQGTAIAASNYRTPESFVGADYAFRPYFTGAMASGSTEYFGLGTVSRQPGLYISHRIDGIDGPRGVVVTKVVFDSVEKAWAGQQGEVVVVDPNGVVLLASRPGRRFTTIQDLPPSLRDVLKASRQFGDSPLDWSGVETAATSVTIDGQPLQRTVADVGTTGWRLEVWTPEDAVVRTVLTWRWIAILLIALMAGAGVWVWRSRARAANRELAEAEARRVLERNVEERTQALTEANAALSGQIGERQEAERRLRRLQSDLVQANRVAQLAQTMAGVAHEINQPVAAIRTHADNARVLLERGETASADHSLSRIQGLTGRIGEIIESLRGLARKGPRALRPVRLGEAIESARLLLESRDRAERAEVRGPVQELSVMADQVRLEQVLINLLQNAFEATERLNHPLIVLEARRSDDWVEVSVEDNGPGVPQALRQTLFMPFATGKAGGLGLGLVISREIVDGFGGTLDLDDGDMGGARFVMRLRIADAG